MLKQCNCQIHKLHCNQTTISQCYLLKFKGNKRPLFADDEDDADVIFLKFSSCWMLVEIRPKALNSDTISFLVNLNNG